MAKRISGLGAAAAADTTYVLEVDEPAGGTLETEKLTIAQVKTLMNIPSNSKVSVTVTSASGATITGTYAELATSGDLSIYNIQFSYASAGEVDPEFTLNQATVGRTFTFVPVTCVVYTSAGGYESETAYMTANTPDRIKVEGTYQTATFYMTIAIVR